MISYAKIGLFCVSVAELYLVYVTLVRLVTCWGADEFKISLTSDLFNRMLKGYGRSGEMG